MTATELLEVLGTVAPVALSDEFCKLHNLYDNSGVIIDGGVDITGALFSLDFSPEAVQAAIEGGYNCIVTHHPAVYGGISRVVAESNPQARAVALCLQKGIAVVSMHLNFDAAPQGIDYYLMRGLGGETGEILAPLSRGGYGRAYAVPRCTLEQFAARIRAEFGTDNLFVLGDRQKSIGKVASFCGAGCDDAAMAFSVRQGVDAFVSADMKHHQIAELVSRGTAVVVLTHYASENYGFRRIYQDIKNRLSLPSAYFTQGNLL